MLKSEVFNTCGDIIVEKRADQSKYFYTTGNVQTYNEAKNIQEKLFSNYVSDTKIIPYFNGVPMTKVEIEKLKSDFPQLRYLD
jgi:hypothetical protein